MLFMVVYCHLIVAHCCSSSQPLVFTVLSSTACSCSTPLALTVGCMLSLYIFKLEAETWPFNSLSAKKSVYRFPGECRDGWEQWKKDTCKSNTSGDGTASGSRKTLYAWSLPLCYLEQQIPFCPPSFWQCSRYLSNPRVRKLFPLMQV